MYEDTILTIILIIINFFMFALIYIGWKVARKLHPARPIIDLVFFFIFYKIAMYYFLPTIFRIASDYQYLKEDSVQLFDLVFIYMIELISWTAWMGAFFIVLRFFSGNVREFDMQKFVNHRLLEAKVLLYVISVGFIVTRLMVIFDIALPIPLIIFQSLFFYVGVAAGPFLVCTSLKYMDKIGFWLGIVLSGFSILMFSTRGALIYFLVFCIFLVWFFTREKKAKLFFVSMFFILFVTYIFSGGLPRNPIIFDEAGNINWRTTINAEKKGDRSVWEEIEWRFGASTRLGTAFINLYYRGDSAGLNPIKNSALGFLPRSINPDKPHPSTLHGDDIYSQGMNIIHKEIHGYHLNYNMVEFPTGGHFYWEFGLLGVLILSAISGIYIAMCSYFFSKLGLLSLPLMVSVFKPWGFMDPKIWVSDIILQLYQIILPLILAIILVRSVRSSINLMKKLLPRKSKYQHFIDN